MSILLTSAIRHHQVNFHPVVPFDPRAERIGRFDLSATNTRLTETIFSDTHAFSQYIEAERIEAGARYLIGGYNELREMYKRSQLFDFAKTMAGSAGNNTTGATPEPRRLHLGTDIWGEAGTPVKAPLGGMVHSLAYNNQLGDYGATIILQHQLDTHPFYTLYGHLALADLDPLREGYFVTRGQTFAHFGRPIENGQWPPHLHFQVIEDIGSYIGDYPGVCKLSERDKYLSNCPDPDGLLNLNRYLPPVPVF
jgi:peptidoglycan LD-endopeptidase LytH